MIQVYAQLLTISNLETSPAKRGIFVHNNSGWPFPTILSNCFLKPTQTFGIYSILWQLIPQYNLCVSKKYHLCFETATW